MGNSSHTMASMVGQLVGNRYRILKEVSAGELDWMFMASDRQQNEQHVALKVLQPQFATQPHMRQRFLDEARLQESLWHPSVAQIQAIQETEEHVYNAVEWIEGETFGEMVQRFGSPFSIDAIIQLLAPVCKVVEYAHNTKVIHHNINPDAIIVDWSGEFLELKVTRFSLPMAQGARQHSDAKTAETHRNVAYISPEQAADTGRVDHRTDVYSIGALMYLLATGRPPFAGAYHQVLQELLNSAPKHPCQVTASCPPVLADVILKCMDKSPEQRFQSVQELLDELKKLRPFAAGREYIEIVGLNPPSKFARKQSHADLMAAGPVRGPRIEPPPAARRQAPAARRARTSEPSSIGKLMMPLAALVILGLIGGGIWYFVIYNAGKCKEGTKRACYTGPEGTRNRGRCREGQQICTNGAFGECTEQIKPAKQEICNGKDDDCDGKIDNSPDFVNLGKDCKTLEGACMTPGKYVCAQDGKDVRCKASRKANNDSELNFIIMPDKQPVTIYYRKKPYKTKGLFCLPKPEGRRSYVTIQSKGYFRCRLRLKRKRWGKGALTIQLRRRRRGAATPRRNYCQQ